LVFKDVENVWLYGINFRYNPQSEKGAIVTLVEAGQCRVARCDFHTRHGDFPQDGHEDRDVDETTDNNLAKAEKMIDSFEIRDDISNISANVISY
jgi:hypothetical protein